MKQIVSILLLVFVSTLSRSQSQFILKGKIEYEKKTNLHKQLDAVEEDEGFRNMIKKTVPAIKTSYFNSSFNGNKTIYSPGREVVTTQPIPEWSSGPASDNIVYSDLNQYTSVSQKTVFDNTFNIEDTLRKMKWKISADTRTIAGFECRKATAIIMDSLFVVAFYTDQIVPSGGPESFAGLPGMILGLAIPRLNTTWFATKVELSDVQEASIAPPKKGKKTNASNLKVQLNSAMKNWGKWRDKYTWQIMI